MSSRHFAPSAIAPSMLFRASREEALIQEVPRSGFAQDVHDGEQTISMPGFLSRAKTKADMDRGYTILPDGSQGVLVRGE